MFRFFQAAIVTFYSPLCQSYSWNNRHVFLSFFEKQVLWN